MADVNTTQIENEEQDLNEILRIRRAKLKDLVDAGQNPYEKVKFDFDTYSVQIKEDFENYENKDVAIAGRIMSRRDMGKANFIDVADGKGRIQCYIKIAEVGEEVLNSTRSGISAI